MEEIIDSYIYCINKKISEAPFNKDEKARVVTKNSDNTYDIVMNGVTYVGVKCKDDTYTVNQIVTVKIPKNNYNNMYIMSEASTGGGGGGDLSITIVPSLPTENISTNTIYLVAKTSTSTNNSYTEYIRVNNQWEILGDDSISSDSYYNKSQINELLTNKLNTSLSNINYNNVSVANINQLLSLDGVTLNLTSNNVTISNAVINDLIAPKITTLDLTSGSILTTDFTIQSSADTNSGLKIVDNTIQFFNDEGEVGIQLGYDTSNSPSLILRDENGSVMLDSDGLHDNIVPNGFIKEVMVGSGQITDEKIDWETTFDKTDNEGNRLWLTSSQVLTSDEFTTKFTEINNTTTALSTRTSNVEQSIEGVASTVSSTTIIANDALNGVQNLTTITEDLQNQIDGAIDSWFYEGTPTLDNLPASEWITDVIKDRHIGDTYTNIEETDTSETSGQSFRFVKENTIYKWLKISDNEVALALQKASQAQASADGKVTYYNDTPTSYHKGDMWFLKANFGGYVIGDVLIAQSDSNFFIADDWTKEDRYTGSSELDVEINSVIQTLNSEIIQTNESISIATNKITEVSDNLENYQEITNSAIESKADSVSISTAIEKSTTIKELNDKIKTLSEQLAMYFNFGVDGLTIRASTDGVDSPYQTKLDNDSLDFLNNGVRTSWIEGEKFYARNVQVEGKTTMGSYVWEEGSDGTLTLTYIGG